MKSSFIIVLLLSLYHSVSRAQTDPGASNLVHEWTFDGGTASDAVTINPINGTLMGGATVVNKVLKLSSQGQYVSFSGASLALNTYTEISQEIWFTSVKGANTGYTMLSYFGNASGSLGYNYVSASAARGDNVSRVAISNGTYNSEVGANGPEYDDGVLHQMVSIIRSDSVILYIDGALVSKTSNTIALTTIGTSLAYLGKGGYNNDPTWIGSISKFSIYNKSLSRGEVKFLYQKGAEQSPIISSATAVLSFDEQYKTELINVSGLNLADSITIATPAGISVTPSRLSPNATNVPVSVTYDGSTPVDQNIIFSSGSGLLSIPVKSYSNNCYTKLYPELTSLISDPYISSINNFAGWGNRSINTNQTYVYCGATSGKVTGTNGGSLDLSLTGKLKTNTVYRVKAKVYTIGGAFQIGVFGWSAGQGDYLKSITNTGSWQDVDFLFKTGSSLGATQGIFFNNYGLAGTTGYIDNWELYAIPKIYVSSSALDFPSPGSKKVAVSGVNLSQNISITAPSGFSVDPTTMLSNVQGDSLTVSFSNGTSAAGYVYFTSGSVKDSLHVSGTVTPKLNTSVSAIVVDEITNTASFRVTAYNISGNVTMTAPSGITLTPAVLSPPIVDVPVTVKFDGRGNSSGLITLTSGQATGSIKLVAARNDECFQPIYSDRTNLITDPTCNTYSADGWGDKGINTDPAFVYCGSRSGKVTNNGSFDRTLTGIMKPSTPYRVKAKVYKSSPVKSGNMGHVTFTIQFDSTLFPVPYQLIKAAMDSACYYYSKYTPFIDNIRVNYNKGVPTAQANYRGSIDFGSDTQYMWVGTAMHEMAHYFGSGTTSIWKNHIVKGDWTGAVANALITGINGGIMHGDGIHYWPYGINYKSEITNLGSQSAQIEAMITHAKIVKAMLVDDCGIPTNNLSVGVGVYGWSASGKDIYHEVETPNSWQDIDFTFTTEASLKATQGVFFNSGTGYIDNWEMYDISPVDNPEENPVTDLVESKSSTQQVYSLDNAIIAEYDLANATSMVSLIYDMQGRLLMQKSSWEKEGHTSIVLTTSLSTGLYIVKIISREFTVTRKLILN